MDFIINFCLGSMYYRMKNVFLPVNSNKEETSNTCIVLLVSYNQKQISLILLLNLIYKPTPHFSLSLVLDNYLLPKDHII